MKQDGAWRPLLEGEAADRVWESIFEVATALRVCAAPDPQGSSTRCGIHGPALFFTYLAATHADREAADVAMAYLDEALETLANTPMGWSLYGGLSGLGWTVQHLEGRLYEPDEDDDDHRLIDDALLAMLDKKPWGGVYDLIVGLVGLGVYGLDGLPRSGARQCLERVVERLAELAEDAPRGITWLTPPEWLPSHQREAAPNGHHNLGVAHGVPGVIAILAEACAAGVAVATAAPLLDQAVGWLLAQELPTTASSCFGTTLVEGATCEPTRLAWCYGDAGVAATLLLAGRRIARQDWEHEALRIARRAAERTTLEEAGVIDGGLCHGAAGLAHLYNRFYQATGDPSLAAVARHWALATLDLRRPGHGVAGYLSYEQGADGVSDWRAVPSFLTGASGIGLALLATVSPIEPAWDRVLLSSIPPRA